MRNQLIAPLILLVMLTGCVAVPPAASTEPAVEGATPVAPAETEVTPEASSEQSSAVAAGECEEGFRLFDHELLVTEPVCIPEAPQRVLALDMASLEMVLLTGQTPIGTADWILSEYPLLVPELADELVGVEGVGYPASLEQVALMKPDLILAAEDTIDVVQAAMIAPIVVPNQSIYEDWKVGMEFFSEVLNVPELSDEMQENYFARVAELQTALGDDINLEISAISASTYGISLWMPDSPPGAILADVGLARPEAQSLVGDEAMAEYGEQMYVQISDERLDLADGNVIYYFTYAATDEETATMESDFIKEFQQRPIWQSLDAVKAERAYFVPGYWWRSQTYLLSNFVLDDLFETLTDTTATTPILSVR